MPRHVSLPLILISLCNVGKIFCANILITEDLASPSHQIWNYALADGLVARGHNVTVLGPKSISLEGHEKFHWIELEGLYNEYAFESERMYKRGVFGNMRLLHEYGTFTCNHSLNTRGFRSLMNYPKDFKFDLILLDITICNCFLPLIQRFHSPPAIGLTALLLPPHISEAFGNNFQASYLPHIFMRFPDNMSFMDRLRNYLLTKLDVLLRQTSVMSAWEEIAKRTFGESMLPFDTLLKRMSLLFCNLSPGFHYSQPLTPNIIPVGGMQINLTKKLPQDLQKIMDNAKNGVILFSLGSNLRSDSLRLEKRKVILEALGKVKQTVLWKFESELADVPKNVIVRKWLPQSEILAHPNLRLFITHGGGLSTIETAFFGVPVVGIPFFVDQYHNMELIVNRKLGVQLDYGTMTAETFLSSIKEVLLNPMYSSEAKKISSIVRDQPQTALERAIFWAEHVMRHNGSNNFDPKSRHMSQFVSSSADIHLFLFLSSVLLLYICFKMLTSLRIVLFSNKQRKSKSE